MPPRDDLSSLEWRMKSGARYTDSRLNWASLSLSGGTATSTSESGSRLLAGLTGRCPDGCENRFRALTDSFGAERRSHQLLTGKRVSAVGAGAAWRASSPPLNAAEAHQSGSHCLAATARTNGQSALGSACGARCGARPVPPLRHWRIGPSWAPEGPAAAGSLLHPSGKTRSFPAIVRPG